MLNPPPPFLSAFTGIRPTSRPEGSARLPLLPPHRPPQALLQHLSCTVGSCAAFFSEDLDTHTLSMDNSYFVCIFFFFHLMHLTYMVAISLSSPVVYYETNTALHPAY